MAPDPGLYGPPDYEHDLEPDEDGVFADARAEMDQWWAEYEETTQ